MCYSHCNVSTSVAITAVAAAIAVLLQVAHDCAEAGADITVYGMNRGPDAAPFDYSKFYVHIMPPNGDDFNDRQLASQVCTGPTNTTAITVLLLGFLLLLLLQE
jgi:hypothetical protein